MVSGERIVAAGFRPGRFAGLIRKSGLGRHALQVVREETRSSLVLNLDADGSARLCRGWRYSAFQDGPAYSAQDRIEAQLGYSGSWAAAAGIVTVELARDDAICPPVSLHTGPIAEPSATWRLRCAAYELWSDGLPEASVLACRLETPPPAPTEDWPHLVPLLPAGPCILLGAGDGLEFTISYDPVGGPPAVLGGIAAAAEPIRSDEWRQA